MIAERAIFLAAALVFTLLSAASSKCPLWIAVLCITIGLLMGAL